MLIDGEKWACEACVRGHRVSSCRHQDRPMIRINKKGRPFSVCSICRGPCNDREEHSKLNRDGKSDGESDAKPSAKKSAQRRRPQPTAFARIAPQPARLPSSTEQEHQQPSHQPPRHSHHDSRHHPYSVPSSANTSSRSLGRQSPSPPASSPFEFPPVTYAVHASMMATAVCTMSMEYPYVTIAPLENPILQSSSYPFQMTNDAALHIPAYSVSDSSSNSYDPTLSWFEDLDDLPEDWSTYFWSQ